MAIEEKIEKLKGSFGPVVRVEERKKGSRYFLYVSPRDLLAVAKFLFNDLGGRLATASGVDTRDGFDIVYHFCFDAESAVVNLQTSLGKDKPEVDSLAPFIAGAAFVEREIHDLFGINFKGHPNLKRLILSDDWPEGVYPLRKDYKL